MKEYLKTVGRIFDIQRFSVHDGPGIRTIVFLKGCFLRCKWCCNPESQKREIEQMTLNNKTKTVGYDTTVDEVMKEVERDRIYYDRSGGGLTLSGGESLAQPDFAVALLKAAKEALANIGLKGEVEYITEFSEIASLGIMTTPALMLDDEIVSTGRVLKTSDIESLMLVHKDL